MTPDSDSTANEAKRRGRNGHSALQGRSNYQWGADDIGQRYYYGGSRPAGGMKCGEASPCRGAIAAVFLVDVMVHVRYALGSAQRMSAVETNNKFETAVP